MTATARRSPKPARSRQPYAWLGAGAIALGVGAAGLAAGSGVAQADTGNASSTGHAGSAASPASAGPKGNSHPTAASAHAKAAVRLELHGQTEDSTANVSPTRPVQALAHARPSAPLSDTSIRVAAAVPSANVTVSWGTVGNYVVKAGDAYAKFSGSMTASVLKFAFADAEKFLGNPFLGRLSSLRLAESAIEDYQNAENSLDKLTSLLEAISNAAEGLLPEPAARLFNLPIDSLNRGVKAGEWIATKVVKLLHPEAFTLTATSSAAGAPDPKTGVVRGNAVFSNPAGGALTYTFTQPGHGAVTVTPSSATGFTGSVQFTYTPDPADQLQAEHDGVVSTDSFTITATNTANGQSDTVKFTTIPIDPGTPQPGTPLSTESTPGADGTVSVTIHTTDFPNGTIKYIDPITTPKYGTISNYDSTAGTFTYTPNSDAPTDGTLVAGSQEQIAAAQTTDPSGAVSGKAVFHNGIADTFTVTASNNVHTVAEDIPITTYLNSGSSPTTGVTYSVTGAPVSGTITAFDSDTGAYTYTPDPDTTDTQDTFTVTATDGSHSATESINVPINDDPLAGTWNVTGVSAVGSAGNLSLPITTGIQLTFTRNGNAYTEACAGCNQPVTTSDYTPMTKTQPGVYKSELSPETVQQFTQQWIQAAQSSGVVITNQVLSVTLTVNLSDDNTELTQTDNIVWTWTQTVTTPDQVIVTNVDNSAVETITAAKAAVATSL